MRHFSLALWFLHGEFLLKLSERGETQRWGDEEEEEDDSAHFDK